MKKFRIILETENCIGCGACVAVCPSRLKMGDDNKSHLNGGKVLKQNEMDTPGVTVNEVLDVDDSGCIQQAADVCPVNVIRIKPLKK